MFGERKPWEKTKNKLELPRDPLHGVPDCVGLPMNCSGRKALGVRRKLCAEAWNMV